MFPDLLKSVNATGVDIYVVKVIASLDSGVEQTIFEFSAGAGLIGSASAARSKVDGRVDTLDDKWISGWLLPSGFEAQKIEVLDGDKIVGSTFTGQFRSDVSAIYHSGAFAGFIMATPADLRDGFPHTVTVRSSAGWVFPGFPRQVRLGKVLGIVEKVDRNVIQGWFGFLKDADRSPTMLQISCNDEPIGVTNLRGGRQDVVAAGLAASANIFRFETKRGIFAEDVISVTDVASGYGLRIADAGRAQDLPSAIVGHLDLAGQSEIIGWAIDRRSPAESLRITVYADGVPIAEGKTEGFRADVQLAYPQALRPGFVIRTPIALRDGRTHLIELRVSPGTKVLSGSPTTVKFSRAPKVLVGDAPSGLTAIEQEIARHLRQRTRQVFEGGVAHIILNRNGGDVFIRCLQSLLFYFDFNRDQLIVVDHASNDITRSALELLEASGLVSIIWKDRNDSFSKSNNDAAAIATKPVLLLLNNDIEFVCDLSRTIERHLVDKAIGAVGIKLFDVIEPSPEEKVERTVRELRIQHLGVWFNPGHSQNDFNLVGYDITTAGTHGEIFGIKEVAVVTGAALGIRADDYERLGGVR